LASTHPASNPKRFALCGSARIANASTLYPWPKGTGFYGYSDNAPADPERMLGYREQG
jgi:hypothetical protein